jgi:glycosyltransferase involved in cell wall biosynthesis
MSIGVAIPCYYGHISRLTNLLDSIENQTCKPNKVVVSCSSTTNKFDTKEYSFPLKIIITEDKKNAAQNRNIAALILNDVDYITFIDADDIMHPQRIEIILKAFKETDCDIILHNYINNERNFDVIEKIDMRVNELTQCRSGCIRHLDFYNHDIQNQLIHHSQCSVKKHIFDKVKYPEEQEFYSREDCVFCHRIFSIPNIKNVYISNPLSLYKQSGTQL